MKDLINEYILALKTQNYDQFNYITTSNIERLGMGEVQKCLNEKLPLHLDTTDMKLLLRYMVDKDEKAYKELVTSLLAEIITVLQKSGFEFGKDFSYKEVKELPTLCIKNMHEDRIAPLYTNAAWKQCSPYIIFMEEK